MVIPLIELRGICKSYGGGESPRVDVLKNISLSITDGEFIAIVGASGSGKSTLMHILGCLDQPTDGQYRFAGKDINEFSADDLAALRREAFGFIFQSYHLIRSFDAQHNVAVPAIYAGLPAAHRAKRARQLLEQFGLGERLSHRPNQLSGGQQQRVSIARALMNGGSIILADEPTGALDSQSGADVMSLLATLSESGRTVIIVTHDREVAAKTRRIIEIQDGHIVSDSGSPASMRTDKNDFLNKIFAKKENAISPWIDWREIVGAAWRMLWDNRFRTALTLLGIVLGVASVIVMLAVGAGAQAQVMSKMAVFGTNRLYVTPGGESARGFGGILTARDAAIVRQLPNVAAAMPLQYTQVVLRAGNIDTATTLWAVTHEASKILNWKTTRGQFFTKDDERTLAPVMLLGKKVCERLFGQTDPIGRYVLVNNVPFQVIGELEEKGAVSGDADDDDLVLTPFSTGTRRVMGKEELSWISVLIADLNQAEQTQQIIESTLEAAHHVRDFRVYNKAASVRAQTETQQTLTLLLGLIAAVSLVVGGIGVMNIMLMAVKERTREIGIRIAVGARQRDILKQFLIEAILVTLLGGIVGTITGLAIGAALTLWDIPVIFSIRAVLAAFCCALLTGFISGFMPARQAAKLDPVLALASE
jgi:macrolide transport system ATP-binding/permease protein